MTTGAYLNISYHLENHDLPAPLRGGFAHSPLCGSRLPGFFPKPAQGSAIPRSSLMAALQMEQGIAPSAPDVSQLQHSTDITTELMTIRPYLHK